MNPKWHVLAWIPLLIPVAMAEPFVDVAGELGVALESNSEWGAGVTFTDYDADGDLDLYVVDGQGDANAFFRNEGHRVFTEIANENGLADTSWGKAVVPADFDNDGDPDLLLTNYSTSETNRLYRNDNGMYVDITAGSGVDFTAMCTGAAWADYDEDGLLDVYITVYSGTLRNRLLHNEGGGSFVDVAEELGVGNLTGWGYQPAWFDYDNDGDLDLYIANDDFFGGTPNVLYRNDGAGSFTDVSVESGANLSMSTMGVAVGDFDNDLDLDLYLTDLPNGNSLLRNNGDGTFSDVAADMGVTANLICWGTDFFDYDHDGRLDLYVDVMMESMGFGEGSAFGGAHPMERALLPENRGTGYANRLFHNLGNGFEDISDVSGAGNEGRSFCSAVGDYDGDGDLDLYVTNYWSQEGDEPSALYENRHIERDALASDWLRVQLVGVTGNRDAVGARVLIQDDDVWQVRERRAGSSYLSAGEPFVHFGLGGGSGLVDLIEVRWPSGYTERYVDVMPGQTITLTEGEGDSAGAEGLSPQPALARLEAWPNPCSGRTTLELVSRSIGAGELLFFGVDGRQVRSLHFSKAGSEPVRLLFDGRDDGGRPLPAGMYSVRVRSNQQSPVLEKVLLVR